MWEAIWDKLTMENFAMLIAIVLLFKYDKTIERLRQTIELQGAALNKFVCDIREEFEDTKMRLLKFEVLAELRKEKKKLEKVEVLD